MIKANKSRRLIRFVLYFYVPLLLYFLIVSTSKADTTQNSYLIFSVRYLVDRERISTFAATDSATLPIDQRTRAELLLLYAMSEYTNRALSIDEQITRLKKNGLIIDNEKDAHKYLSIISYFRLASYWRPMEKSPHQFKPNSRFENALSLYYFDKELRALIFSAIQSIEIALRTKVIHNFSMAYGPFWFMDDELVKSSKQQQENLVSLRKELERSKEDFIQDHYHKYTSPDMPPAWKTLEVASFGVLSKLYGNFKDKSVKKSIARSFGVPQHEYLESWMRSIAVLRNCCAHHARIWNRRFSMIPQLPKTMTEHWIVNTKLDAHKLYVQLCCIVYWQNSIYEDNDFVENFKLLLLKYPNVDITAMGFPKNWEEEPLWR